LELIELSRLPNEAARREAQHEIAVRNFNVILQKAREARSPKTQARPARVPTQPPADEDPLAGSGENSGPLRRVHTDKANEPAPYDETAASKLATMASWLLPHEKATLEHARMLQEGMRAELGRGLTLGEVRHTEIEALNESPPTYRPRPLQEVTEEADRG